MEPNKKFDISIIPTVIVFIILGIGFWLGARKINNITVENSLNVLSNSASRFASEIARTIEMDKNQLRILAGILTEHGDIDSNDTKEALTEVSKGGTFSHLRVITPEDKVFIYKNGSCTVEEATQNFEEEVAKGDYVSNIVEDASGKRYIYQTVAIEKDGKVLGLLCGVVELDALPDKFYTEVFDSSAQVFVIDGDSGEFILNSWGGYDNLYDVPLEEVTLNKKYDYDLWISNLKQGNEDCIAVTSEEKEEYYYAATVPIKINQWRVMAAVPESVVFKRISGIRCIIRDLLIIAGILLLIYLTSVVVIVRKEIERNDRQMKNMAYMYDVQKALFDSQRGKDSVVEGLKRIGNMMDASLMVVSSFENMEIEEIYQWSDADSDNTTMDYEKKLRELYEIIRDRLKSGESILSDVRDKASEMAEWNFKDMKEAGVSNVMIVPIFDSEGKLAGALGAFNTKRRWRDTTLLDCTSWNFMMALSNIKSYKIIQRMGTIDAITGLKNRNCYEERLRQYIDGTSKDLHCIYMDANGLHELNNTLGHAAGDEMLRSIADAIKELFGKDSSYRVGGDEFVVFCEKLSEDEILKKLDEMKNALLENDYYVSIGVVKGDSDKDISKLVSEAEKKMYEAKRKYYEENAHADRRCRI